MATFGPNCLIPASTASFDLYGLFSASTILSRPQRPYPGLHGLIRPQRPYLTSTVSSWPPRPYRGLYGLVRPLWSRLGHHGLIPTSMATFGPNGLILVSMALCRPLWSRSTSMVSSWPPWPYLGFHVHALFDLYGPVRPRLASATSFGLNGLTLASMASFHLTSLIPSSMASFGLIPDLYCLTMTPTVSFNLVDSARLKDYPITLSSIIGGSLTLPRCKANLASTSL
uniref:Uncharacterized protein n=1 Tax=Fagus sylvatica TaxID=28930 RepID=A0A2N9FY16_FAGSY